VILVDTSVWIDHLHATESSLVAALESWDVCAHPMVIGELALGSPWRRRSEFLATLADLPRVNVASHAEILHLIEARRLHGRGLSLVDAHLLGALLTAPGVRLWTRDKRLRSAAGGLGITAVED
jgi:predicted nucleic acid-binding protein